MDLERWNDARDMAKGALDLIESYRVGRGDEANVRGFLAFITLRLGDRETALSMARRAVEMAVEREVVAAEHGCRRMLGRVLLEIGGAEAVADAERGITRSLEVIRDTGQRGFEPGALLDLAEAARVRGDAAAQVGHLRSAQRLYTEMGMGPRAEAIEAQLGAL